MNENEIRLIRDLYNHYDQKQDINDEFLKSLTENYGTIRGILMNVILKYDSEAEITDEYLDAKLNQYNIDLKSNTIQDDAKESKEDSPLINIKPQEKTIVADDSTKKTKKRRLLPIIIIASIAIILSLVIFYLNSTKPSEKSLNNVEIELIEFVCGDNCYIYFKQVNNPEITYDYHNFEFPINIPGKEYIAEIRDEYYRYGEKSSLIGKKYFVDLELKNVKDWEETEYGPKNNDQFVDKWIITSIRMTPGSRDILNNKKEVNLNKSSNGKENDITNENSFTPFNIKIKDGKKYLNIRKSPINGSVVGKVSEKENYTVSQEYKSNNPLYLLNKKMILKDVKSGEEVEKPKSFKLNNVVSIDEYTYKAEVINLDKTTNKVYIQKSDVDLSFNKWYYLNEVNGWIYSEFCEKLN